ncbi:glycosyltransferase family 2 protein [Paenibacillus sp. KQZ6P-2]|uniref:Glycosyltransferase family 2 protein n=1 Tax=Paenibacillus mangrovi TaxID=2931978 RepID=A0A9X1WSG1_9BACL|nr:glycosyltransferase family 2 protein [Paenibacillus mangrovi]MCJ8010879.1 glycosyltransferase family 2 protein [Paenibacillus mangrovi]
MGSGTKSSMKMSGVSIITCTNRRGFLKNLIQNYIIQNHPKKELIIIVNNDKIPLAPYERLASDLPNVRVFRKPEKNSLGACLNFAVKQTKYDYIAKFDDDDYYAPDYLQECLLTFQKTNADVIGKRAHYMYLEGSKTMILRFSQAENKPAAKLPGATLVMKRHVFNKVQFPNKNVGEDDLFCIRCKKKGFHVYSGGKFNFVAIRRKNSSGHTWIISDKELIKYHKVIPNVNNYREFVMKTSRY